MTNDTTGFRYRTLRSLARGVNALAWPIALGFLFLAAASIYITIKGFAPFGIQPLGFTGNPNDLLRSDAPYHQKYLEYTGEFRAEEDYIIVVAGEEFERNREAVEFIAGELKNQPDLFKKVFYKIDIKELAEERGLLFLEVDQLREIEKDISDFVSLLGKDRFSLDLNSLLAVASEKFDSKHLRKSENEAGVDAFAEEFVKNLNALADRLEGKTIPKTAQFGDFMAKNSEMAKMQTLQAQNEYLSLEEGRMLIIQIPSTKQEASFGDHAYIIEPMRRIIEQAREKYPGLEIGLTGEPALSEDEAQASEKDTTNATIITFVLIALLFWISFSEFTRPALALIVLLLAVCLTIGFTTLFIGRLNILSITFFPMILGLGIDFGVQILGRYEEELPKAQDVVTALTQTIMNTGNAILTGASTTAVAFYTMCLNDFSGLSEMGLISGTGILLCLLCYLVLFPALLAIRDRKVAGKAVAATDALHIDESKRFIDRLILQNSWTIIFLALVLTALAAWQIPKVWFDYNLLNLQNPKLESVQFEHRLLEAKDARSVTFAALVTSDLEEAARKTEQFKKLPSVFEVVSMTEIVPRNQEEKLQVIRRIKQKLENIKLPKSGVKVNVTQNIQVLRNLKANLGRMNKLAQTWASSTQKVEAAEFFGRLLSAINRSLNVLGSMSQKKAEEILSSHQTQVFSQLRKNLEQLKNQKVDRPISAEDLPKTLRDRYVGKTGKVVIEIYPRENVWDREPLERFVKDLRSVDSKVTGTPIQNYEYIELLKVSYEQAGRNALIAIVILITLHFRSLKYILPTLLPLGMGIVWTLGVMPVLGIPFNPANIITLPLVIGVGVAFGVYAVDRYRENA
jgi:uncharacterized protein